MVLTALDLGTVLGLWHTMETFEILLQCQSLQVWGISVPEVKRRDWDHLAVSLCYANVMGSPNKTPTESVSNANPVGFTDFLG